MHTPFQTFDSGFERFDPLVRSLQLSGDPLFDLLLLAPFGFTGALLDDLSELVFQQSVHSFGRGSTHVEHLLGPVLDSSFDGELVDHALHLRFINSTLAYTSPQLG